MSMVILVSACGTFTKTVEREVPIEKEVPVYPPESLLVECEKDPKITVDTVTNEHILKQSRERAARLERCSIKIKKIINWRDSMIDLNNKSSSEENGEKEDGTRSN